MVIVKLRSLTAGHDQAIFNYIGATLINCMIPTMPFNSSLSSIRNARRNKNNGVIIVAPASTMNTPGGDYAGMFANGGDDSDSTTVASKIYSPWPSTISSQTSVSQVQSNLGSVYFGQNISDTNLYVLQAISATSGATLNNIAVNSKNINNGLKNAFSSLWTPPHVGTMSQGFNNVSQNYYNVVLLDWFEYNKGESTQVTVLRLNPEINFCTSFIQGN